MYVFFELICIVVYSFYTSHECLGFLRGCMIMTIHPDELNHIISDPSAMYHAPEDVLVDARLSRDQKIAVLKQWAYDEKEIEVAEEENMRTDATTTILHQVLIVLRQLEHP
jgi:hypothetical protein